MNLNELHCWNVSASYAKELQSELAAQVKLSPLKKKYIKWVGGIDVSFNRYDPTLYAGVVVMSFPDLKIQETATAIVENSFPYIPGYLSFRELPAVCEALEKLKIIPDVILCDGQGIAHPRRLGIASHLGLFVNLPTIGCAKSVLVGKYRDPGLRKGSTTPLLDHGEQIGVALRTRDKVKPVFVSPGHLIDFEGAVDITLSCTTRYRLPLPTREAHNLVNRLRRKYIPTKKLDPSLKNR